MFEIRLFTLYSMYHIITCPKCHKLLNLVQLHLPRFRFFKCYASVWLFSFEATTNTNSSNFKVV
jgi:hypothetical protein